MDKFYIDRQFGLPIWIDVENGIVQNCYNEEPNYVAKMNELYVGKSITFLNEDFIGRAMKGTYHHLRPECITTSKLKVEHFASRIRNLWNQHSHAFTTVERRAEIKGQIKELEPQQYACERELIAEKERILTEHNFVS